MKFVSNGKMIEFPPRGPAGPDGNPIGTIISYMGKVAPDDYLICDGSIYSVSEYQDLADFFQKQFGSPNYFGGDGSTTFAVPDMRNLFLRGYHGEGDQQLSGDIGVKQEGTSHIFTYADSYLYWPTMNQTNTPLNYDSSTPIQDNCRHVSGSKSASTTMRQYYTARPVNMAVLYCIKAVESLTTYPVLYTENGWNVRKWSDGYVELLGSFDHTLKSSEWTSWGNIYSIGFDKIPLYSYPFPLIRVYSEKLDVTTSSTVAVITNGMRVSNDKTKHYGLCRGTKPSETITFKLNYSVTGQWK